MLQGWSFWGGLGRISSICSQPTPRVPRIPNPTNGPSIKDYWLMHRIKFCIYRWCTYQVPAFKAEFHFLLINLITQRTRFQVSHEYLTALLEGGVGDRGEGLMAFHSTHARCCRTWENVRRWGFRHPCVSDVSFRQFAWKWVWSIGRETRLRCSSHCWESVWLNLPSSFWEESLPMTSLLTSLTSYRFWRLAEGWYSKR